MAKSFDPNAGEKASSEDAYIVGIFADILRTQDKGRTSG
jgi:hypothetical protein